MYCRFGFVLVVATFSFGIIRADKEESDNADENRHASNPGNRIIHHQEVRSDRPPHLMGSNYPQTTDLNRRDVSDGNFAKSVLKSNYSHQGLRTQTGRSRRSAIRFRRADKAEDVQPSKRFFRSLQPNKLVQLAKPVPQLYIVPPALARFKRQSDGVVLTTFKNFNTNTITRHNFDNGNYRRFDGVTSVIGDWETRGIFNGAKNSGWEDFVSSDGRIKGAKNWETVSSDTESTKHEISHSDDGQTRVSVRRTQGSKTFEESRSGKQTQTVRL